MNEKESLAIKLNDDINSGKNEDILNEVSQELRNKVTNGVYSADDLDGFFRDFNELGVGLLTSVGF